MSQINFFTEDISFDLQNKTQLIEWVSEIIKSYSQELEEINYIFCSDTYLHQINLEYLQHDTFTDIITFNNSELEGSIESDIFISVDRIKENSASLGIPFTSELHRVMIHGVLHLLGYSDHSDEEKKVMREKEEACLSLLKIESK